jgi:hypothetical protein
MKRWDYHDYGAGWSISLRLVPSWLPFFVFAIDGGTHEYIEFCSLSWSSSEGLRIQRSYRY